MKKEIKIYLIDIFKMSDEDIKRYDEYTDEEFIRIAKEQNNVFTLKMFEHNLNNELINTENYFFRFIEDK